MRTVWQDGGSTREVVSPLSLIVSAFAPCEDARATLTPQLRTDCGPTELLLIDIGRAATGGGSILAQVFGRFGNQAPDVDAPETLARFFPLRPGARTGGTDPCLPRPGPTRACSRRVRNGVCGPHRLTVDVSTLTGMADTGERDSSACSPPSFGGARALLQVRTQDLAMVLGALEEPA